MKKIKLALHWQILIAIILGGLFGFFLTEYIAYVNWMGTVFMRLLKMIIVPLVFCTVTVGVANISATDGFLRLGGKTLGIYLLTCLCAIITGLVLVNVIKPGEGLNITLPEAAADAIGGGSQLGFRDMLIRIVPENVFMAFSTMDMMGVIVFAILFGLFLGKSKHQFAPKVQQGIDSFGNVVLDLTQFILKLTPYGVFGLIANVVATDASNADALARLVETQGLYVLTVFLAMFIHMFITTSIILYLMGKINPFKHLARMKDVLLMGFSTASSNGTLPLTLSHVKSRCGVSDKVANFSLPLGATINMNGTSLYIGIAVIFIAQCYGVQLPFAQQILVLLATLMAGIGTAGIPMASLALTIVILGMIGLPPEAIGLILLVDRFLDMARSMMNIYGDTVAAVIVAKSEGEKLL